MTTTDSIWAAAEHLLRRDAAVPLQITTPPNIERETQLAVRWLVDTPAGRVGAWNRASLEYLLGNIPAQAAPAAVAHQGVVVWPVMPPSKGQSPVLFEDGYAEGWAKCLEACRVALAAASTTQATSPAVVEPLTADGVEQPKNGQHWRVEWWNESCRMMLPTHLKLDSFQSYKNGTLMFTIKEVAHGIGIKKGEGNG